MLKKLLPSTPELPDPQKTALQQELRDIAEDFLTVALTTPLRFNVGPKDVPLSKRAVWVKRHIFTPASELIDALSDTNAPMRSGWPDLLDANGPNRSVLIRELTTLRDYARDLAWNLQSRAETTKVLKRSDRETSRGANHTQEFRLDLANALREVFVRYYAGLPISLGTYDQQHGMQGQFLAFINGCFNEILGEKVSDHLLRALLKPMRGDELGAD